MLLPSKPGGTTVAISDSTGSMVQSYGYDPYGTLTSSIGSIANPFQFQGQFLDAASGLYYLRARFYDSTTLQFTSRDPLQGITRQTYQYVGDSPINRVDAAGLCWPSWACGVENSIGQAVSGAAAWANENQGTISTIATVLAVVGVACGLGIITAETSCLIVGIAALGLGAVLMGTDAAHGDWGMLAIDTFGEFTGLAGLRASMGSARAVFWAFASLCDARAQWQAPTGK